MNRTLSVLRKRASLAKNAVYNQEKNDKIKPENLNATAKKNNASYEMLVKGLKT